MKLLAPLLLTSLLLASAAAQGSVIETRVFDQEVFTANSVNYLFDLGLQGPTVEQDGTVVRVTMALEIVQDYDVQIRNLSGSTTEFRYGDETCLLPAALGDCTAYQYVAAGEVISNPVNDGDLAVLADSVPHSVNATWTSFQSGCGAPWEWTGLDLWFCAFSTIPRLSYNGGFSVPQSWIEVLQFDFTVTGTFTVEWIPTPIPSQSICPGNAPTPVTLSAGGTDSNFWLLQSGAPDSWNLLLASRDASSVVAPSGLCVGAGGAAVLRLGDSLSLGGEPHRYPVAPVLSGQLIYFQSRFRSPGGSFTSECIGVSLP